MRAKVGAIMPLPPKASSQRHDQQPQVQGGNRVRVHSGMSLEELKRETAYRLGHADAAAVDGSSEPNFAGVGVGVGVASKLYHHRPPNEKPYPPREAQPYSSVMQHKIGASSSYNNMMMLSPSQQNRMQYPSQQDRECSPSLAYQDTTSNHYTDSRIYTDSQLGVGGGNRTWQDRGNNEIPITSQPFGYNIPTLQSVQVQQLYSTPRLPRHATVLKDRGSAENSAGLSDHSPGGIENVESNNYGSKGSTSGGCQTKSSPSSMARGNRAASQNSNKNSSAPAAISHPPKVHSYEGRRTPVRDQMEGQILFATPSHGWDAIPSTTPTSTYSEPPRNKTSWNRPSSTMSPSFHRLRSPDHYAGGGGYSKGVVNNSKGLVNKQHQSKLPHGLTVQELKEMTRVRLAAEAETGGPDGSSDQSVHSAGSDQFSAGGRGGYYAQASESMARQQVTHSNEPIRMEFYNQGVGPWISQGQHQPHPPPQMHPQNMSHHQYPRHTSPGFGAGPYHINGNVPPPSPSPAFGSSAGHTKSQGDTWDTATAASDYSLHATYSSSGSDAPILHGNRGRCFSAGATPGVSCSSEKNQSAYYGNAPSMGAVNRQECLSITPPGMLRLHEDRPLFFSNDEKSKLAIPPLSEPRLRLHSTGGLSIHASSYSQSQTPTPNNVADPFVTIGKMNDQSWSQHMPTRIVGRNMAEDSRALSSGSAISGHGNLPSSMAEAVLASITSNASGAPIGGQVIGPPRFHSMSDHALVSESAIYVSGKPVTSGSVIRVDDNNLPETSGSNMPLFASGEPRNIFSPKTLLETHSWGFGLGHNLWVNGPALRGRAATDPVWFGGNDSILVSRIDPQVEANTFVNMNPQNH